VTNIVCDGAKHFRRGGGLA